jgi:hypothetical protein
MTIHDNEYIFKGLTFTTEGAEERLEEKGGSGEREKGR